MIKHLVMIPLIVLGLAVPATQAQTPKWPELNKENISKGIGAITGAIIGSQIGGGRGRAAAIALGTLAGYWAGGRIGAYLTEQDRKAMNQATTQAISTGQSSSWRNPDTGTVTQVSVEDYNSEEHKRKRAAVDRLPPIELLNTWYLPNTDINVRGGPGTDFEVLHTITKGEQVPVIGKVIDRNWYLIAEQGKASGFLYAPLMQLDTSQPRQQNAIRMAAYQPQPGRYSASKPDCRLITQTVSLKNGESESHRFKVCQKTNGHWERI